MEGVSECPFIAVGNMDPTRPAVLHDSLREVAARPQSRQLLGLASATRGEHLQSRLTQAASMLGRIGLRFTGFARAFAQVWLLVGAAALGISGASCRTVSDPTPEELAVADCGPQPDLEFARSTSLSWMLVSEALVRPQGSEPLVVAFGDLHKGWFRPAGNKRLVRFGWVLPGEVSTSDGEGSSATSVPWHFFFRGDALIGVGYDRSRGAGDMEYREIEPSAAPTLGLRSAGDPGQVGAEQGPESKLR
jgi:hypothetical protein